MPGDFFSSATGLQVFFGPGTIGHLARVFRHQLGSGDGVPADKKIDHGSSRIFTQFQPVGIQSIP